MAVRSDARKYKKRAYYFDKKGNKREAIKYLRLYLDNELPNKICAEDYNIMGCLHHELFMEEGNNDLDLVFEAIKYFEKALFIKL